MIEANAIQIGMDQMFHLVTVWNFLFACIHDSTRVYFVFSLLIH